MTRTQPARQYCPDTVISCTVCQRTGLAARGPVNGVPVGFSLHIYSQCHFIHKISYIPYKNIKKSSSCFLRGGEGYIAPYQPEGTSTFFGYQPEGTNTLLYKTINSTFWLVPQKNAGTFWLVGGDILYLK